ncbi:SDR family NAD(P)-dependent oxidoreductase [Streptomyces sp. NPDC059866]|uniref:SDR family NAD(P)-dependent oxidoreductase n=1 Tax=Streptomyces sp. NPDC059866 TaxID=3346978 RepID=UPI00364ADF8A
MRHAFAHRRRLALIAGEVQLSPCESQPHPGAGAHVTLAVRNEKAGREAADEITAKTGNGDVHVASLELADRASVAAFVDAWDGPLDILVNNAGVMNLPTLQLSSEGWELQFATNHLGHFALTAGLHDALAAAGGAPVVSVGSGGHHASPVVFDDINFERRPYDGWSAYGQSKTANILMALEAGRRWANDGILVNSLHPGSIRTNLHRHIEMTPEIQAVFDAADWKTDEQGAATSVLLAASPVIDGISGRYFEDCNEAVVSQSPDKGVAPHALDEDAAARLWDLSLQATRV